jgi:hypothetical protein
MFENELEHHPEARLLDLYKLFMQSCLGPGHIIKDYESVKHYLKQEVVDCQQYVSRFKSGSKHDYFVNLKEEYKTDCSCPCLVLDCDAFLPIARYSLQLIIDDIIPLDDFYQAFIKSYEETEYMNEEALVDIWCTDALPILKGYDIEGFEEDMQYIDELFLQKKYLISHSNTYREKYKPSYRLINKRHMQEYEAKIQKRYFNVGK